MAAAQVAGEAVVSWDGWVPTKNWMPHRVKGVETVSFSPAQYSPGQKRKKKSIQASSEITFSLGDPPWAMDPCSEGWIQGEGTLFRHELRVHELRVHELRVHELRGR